MCGQSAHLSILGISLPADVETALATSSSTQLKVFHTADTTSLNISGNITQDQQFNVVYNFSGRVFSADIDLKIIRE